MIEFKAECGHTVRVKEEDAGGAVRCSYCGRSATIPGTRDDNLDFLFRDTDQHETLPDPPQAGGGRRRGIFSRRPRSSTQVDPFAIVLKMCYAAALLIIVIVVGKKFVLPLFEEGGLSGRTLLPAQQPVAEIPPESDDDSDVPSRMGLIGLTEAGGLYVGVTPPAGAVYCVEASKAPASGRINEVEGRMQARPNGDTLRLDDGTYVVEVALPWNDPSLNDPRLPYYDRYRSFRRALEHASDDQRVKLMEDFFVPDEAWPVFIDETDEQIYLVRQYRGVKVQSGESKGVRALFLPRIALGSGKGFSIAQLAAHYLPDVKRYRFDLNHVRSELDYYGVPVSDRGFVIEALARVGVIPFVTSAGRTRLFKIGIHDGVFATKILREP